jgi:hypothetical protein
MNAFITKSLLRRSALLLSAGAAAVVACQSVGCSSNDAATGGSNAPGPNADDPTGSVGVALTLPGGQSLATLSWTVTNTATGAVVQQANVNVQNSLSINFVVGNLASGINYTITLTGTAVGGGVSCAGSATFTVTPRATTNVSVFLRCTPLGGDSGSVAIGGQIVDCAVVNGTTATPSETSVGTSLALQAQATGVDPAALTYAWSAPSGTFSSASGAATNFTCTVPGPVTVTVTVGDGAIPDGGSCDPSQSTTTVSVLCDPALDGGGATDATTADSGSTGNDAGDGGGTTTAQALFTTLDPGVTANEVTINVGTAIGEGSLNGATPATLTDTAADPNNTQTITTNAAGDILATGTVPDTAAGFCNYPTDGGAPTRISYVTGAKFETTQGSDPMVPMAPFYFPLVFNTINTPTPNAFGGQPPVIGLFDWRPKDIDEALVAAESDDNGKTWYFMQTVLELNPDYTNPISGGFGTSSSTGCPSTITSTNANFVSANGSQADDGWGHATVIQLPGAGNIKTGQFLYMLDRNTNDIPGTNNSIVDNAPLHVINLAGASNKFPVWNTNNTSPGNNDIKSISSALTPSVDAGANLVTVQNSVGLLNPDGIMAVFPTAATAAAGSAVTVLYVQKILNGDDTGSTAMPAAQQCNKAPFSGKSNHDISNVRLATTTDGVNFTDLGVVQGLNDPTTVDYTKTRWVSPRGTLLDINGDGSLWGLYFSGGNCLDGDSDAFHFIGYAESADMVHWIVYNGVMNPIASINPITVANQAGGATVTVPGSAPLIPTQSWFAERLYAPTATRVDATHLSMTFAGYGVQTPANDLLDYRAIGNVVLTVSKPLPAGVPNNVNTH